MTDDGKDEGMLVLGGGGGDSGWEVDKENEDMMMTMQGE